MKRPWTCIAWLLISLGAAGCARTAVPDLFHPGNAKSQQNRALRYDPYPENDAGPPVVGARPREYERGTPEPSRARWQLGNWGQ